MGKNKTIPSHPAQEILGRISPQALTVTLQVEQQPRLIFAWPLDQKAAKAAVVFYHVHDHPGIFRYGPDFLHVPDNALIRSQSLQHIWRDLLPVGRHKALKSRFKTRPFVLNYPPDKARLEDAASHLGQIAIVRDLRQAMLLHNGREQEDRKSVG